MTSRSRRHRSQSGELVREAVGQPAKTVVSLQSGRELAERAGEESRRSRHRSQLVWRVSQREPRDQLARVDGE
jgi:hypothetical protein